MSIVNNDFTDVMTNRHSIRQFDPSVTIDHDEVKAMIKEATTAPSACNLQSWHFVVIDTPAAKEKLKEAAMKFNYPQIDTASTIIYIAGDTQSHKVYRELWNKVYEAGDITKEKLESIFNTFLPLYEHADCNFLTLDATLDGAMVGMQLLLAARAHGYEANPWSGYDFKKILPAVGLDPARYVPVMAVSIGKPAEKPIASPRYDVEQLIEFRD